jgi:hypothetical protein
MRLCFFQPPGGYHPSEIRLWWRRRVVDLILIWTRRIVMVTLSLGSNLELLLTMLDVATMTGIHAPRCVDADSNPQFTAPEQNMRMHELPKTTGIFSGFYNMISRDTQLNLVEIASKHSM